MAGFWFMVLFVVLLQNWAHAGTVPDPFAPLFVYDGTWTVLGEHPWSGSAVGSADRLVSTCRAFSLYFACEQKVNGKVQGLLIYSVGNSAGHLHSRLIAPDGLAAARGDLTLDGNHWTYLDKPPATLKGNWSRVENTILDHDHIQFEEWESADEGRTWKKTNSGTEVRESS
jgi:hypothetical protein